MIYLFLRWITLLQTENINGHCFNTSKRSMLEGWEDGDAQAQLNNGLTQNHIIIGMTSISLVVIKLWFSVDCIMQVPFTQLFLYYTIMHPYQQGNQLL